MSVGLTFASTVRRSLSGTINMIGFARGYGAAYRVNREFMHCAGLGRANVDTPQQILRGNFSFGELRQLGPHLCQLLRALAPHVLINLDDLLLHFGDFALSLGNGCNELSLLSTEPGRFPLKCSQLADRHELLFPKLTDPIQFFDDKFDLGIFGGNLRVEATNLLNQLRSALLQLLLLSISSLASQLEMLFLSSEHLFHHHVRSLRQKLVRKANLVCAGSLSIKSRLASQEFVDRVDEHGEVRPRLSFIELNQDLPSLDVITFLHAKLTDDTSCWVLDLLHIQNRPRACHWQSPPQKAAPSLPIVQSRRRPGQEHTDRTARGAQ